VALHIDIMRADPLVGAQRPLAQVVMAGGRVVIHAEDEGYWRATLTQIVGIDPEANGETFFEALPAKLDGTYVYATPPHEEGDCSVTHGVDRRAAHA
jgi:hypothetical protein